MGKTTKPWLNYKSNEADTVLPERKYKTRRSYKKALMFLILTGFAGGHRFYLYDEKRGWKIFGIYFVLVIAASFLTPYEKIAYALVVLGLAAAVFTISYRALKADVEQANREIMND